MRLAVSFSCRTSVVVTAYRAPESLRLALLALARQTRTPDEVLVADDGSGPDVLDALSGLTKDLPFPVAHVWQPDEGFRAARSRNNAIFHARNESIVFLDNDVIPHRACIDEHAGHIGPRRACLARIIPLDPKDSARLTSRAIESGEFESWFRPEHMKKLRGQQRKYTLYAWMRRLRLPFKRTRPSFSSGNASAWRSDLFRVNGFDEEYIGWGQEDDDLGRRLYMSRVRPVPLVTRAMASHIHHAVDRPDWGSGPNMPRYRTKLNSYRCTAGLDAHPHEDVKVTRLD